MRWAAVKSFVVGKYDDDRCEDAFYSGQIHAVIDGATDKSGLVFEYDGRQITGGRFVVEVVLATLPSLSPSLTPREMETRITRAVAVAIDAQHPELSPFDRPCASLVVFNPVREEIWWAGDCRFAVQTPSAVAEPRTGKEIDELASGLRAAVLASLSCAGTPWLAESGTADPGREAIMPLLRQQSALQNTTGRYGFGVINGTRVPDEHLRSYSTANATKVVLTSDGYPKVSVSGQLDHALAEEYLATVLRADPMCVSLNPACQAVGPGMNSFDDRCWLEITTPAE